MGDIRTTKTIEVEGDYRVTVAEHEDGYEAAVTEVHTGSAITQSLNAIAGSGDPEWSRFVDEPRVTDSKKYVAVGKAIEEFLEEDDDEQ
ncbi:hypothetical protein [Natrialba taiwanensis]|uniref:Uncharacterized protein n=1 Tax=Natrialba taiwanensis DSM 12281 TaxID=1230458 RepID=L9ZYP1_9EURY|nr:hypothetical protein [Natrialba taiwanensis]ELY91434.1 hypothetical protein C484_10416 [Natrialba taiwanensis DSM 12281]